MKDFHSGNLLNGRYRIGDVLTIGGIGVVYAACDTRLYDKPVAIKVLQDHRGAPRYRLEVQVLAGIQHPGVAAPYDWGTTESGELFSVWELINGKSLRELVPPTGMDFQRAGKILRQLGQALAAVHNGGVCHRDLTPMAVMVRNVGTDSESPVIVDFGMAELEGDLRGETSSRLGFCLPYAAPELLVGRANMLSDIYSFGAIAYVVVTGHTPSHPVERTAEWPPNPTAVRSDLPMAAVRAILKALSTNPEERYLRATDFGDELANALSIGSFCVGSPPRPLRVFLCHSAADKMSVRNLYSQLRAEGIDAWLDEEKLLPGQNWQLEIANAVRCSDVVVVCLSRTSVTKEGFVQKEIKWALDVADEKPEGTIFVIPLRLEECNVPNRLRSLQWVDLSRPKSTETLLQAMRSRARTIAR